MYSQSRPTCGSCDKTFSAPRGLKNHQKTCPKHLEQTGQSPVCYPCNSCGSLFSRSYDVGRHRELGQCPGAPLVTGTQTVTPRKHVLSAHYEESPSQRLRTASPTRSHAAVGYDTVTGVVSCETTVVVPELDHTDEKLDVPVHMQLQHEYDDGMSAVNLVLPDGNSSSSTVGEDLLNGDPPDENDFHQVTGGAKAYPLTGSSDFESATLPAEDTPVAVDGAGKQILPTTSCEAVISNVDSVDATIHRLSRTSLEVKETKRKRSSFASSVASVCSATSQWTLPSVRSFLTNPSLRHLAMSQISNPSIRSSNPDFRRASTVPSEMPAPMLGQIDKELEYSRGLSSRFERHMPGRRHKALQRGLHERLWAAVSTNRVEEVNVILATGRGIIDVNCPDENGFTPLLLAAYHGHEGIVTILLEQEHIDVHREDLQKLTAMQWAQRLKHFNIVDQLEAYLFYERENKGKEYRNVDSGGICCEILTLPPKTLDRAFSGSVENQRALWQACELGDAIKVARLVTDKKVDVNCLNPHGRTPPFIAASHGNHAVVSWLLGYNGVDTAIPDANGATALTWAASQGQIRAVQILLCHEGAASRNDIITTASMALAQKNGHKEIVEMLMLDWEAISSLRPVYHASAWTNIT